ncbi:hypothetical protein ATY81_00935 [Rhizobium sp. R72]|nr:MULTISPECIES: hypothetical protein [unclassified Rhizobium]OWW04587.1 hypothetical protein ATY81_00935 [Rhizobium sp. R72]OWW05644.1 hypothetical protein ATY80_00935 [Rhizobium sp. R711]
MSKCRAFVAAAMLIGLAVIVSACTTEDNSNRADFQYQPRHSVNPACSHGFRPTNALSCAY